MRARYRTIVDVPRALVRSARTIGCDGAPPSRSVPIPGVHGPPRFGQPGSAERLRSAGRHWERVCQRGIIHGKEIAAAALASFPSGEEDPTMENRPGIDTALAQSFGDLVGPGSGRLRLPEF